VLERYAVVDVQMLCTVLRKRIDGGVAMDGVKISKIGDGTKDALDVASVLKFAQQPRNFLTAYRGQRVEFLLDVEERDDLIDGKEAETHEAAEY
jgi:hypothetical protein